MFNVLADLPWLGFVLALVVSVVLAGVWFGAVIAKPYLAALGRSADETLPSGLARNVGPLVCTLLVTLTTAVLVEALDITTAGDAVAFGLIVGIGYLGAMTFQIALNPNFPRPLLYGVLNAPYFVVSAVVSAAILVGFR